MVEAESKSQKYEVRLELTLDEYEYMKLCVRFCKQKYGDDDEPGSVSLCEKLGIKLD